MDDELFDICWREDGRHGAHLCRTGQGVDPEILVTFSWAPQYSDGWRRYAWTVIEREPPQKISVIVIASPEVEISSTRGVKNSMAPDPVTISFVRLQRADSVPQAGEPVQLGELLLPESPVVATRQSEVDSLVEMAPVNPAIVRALDEQTAHVRQMAAGHVISHHSWQVAVTVDQHTAAAYSIEVYPHPAPGLYLQAPSVFVVLIIRQGAVEVEYLQVTDQVALPLIGYQEEHSRADVHVLDVDPGVQVPLSGLFPELSRGQAEVKPGTLNAPSFESAMFDFAFYGSLGASLVSIPTGSVGLAALGTIYDLSLLMYATTTGRDFAGDEVTQGQLLLMGVFGMVSVAGDLSAATMKVAKTVEGKLFVGANLVKSGSSFWAPLPPYLRKHLSPIIADAMKRIADSDALRLLQAIEDSVKGLTLGKVKTLSALVDQILTPLIRSTKYVDNIPVPLYVHEMNKLDIADTATFQLLDGPQRETALANFRRALEAEDPGLLNLREISEVLAAEYTGRILDGLISRVFNPALTGFRRPGWGPITSGLDLGYKTYETGKVLKAENYRDVIEWVLVQAQRGNSRYLALATAELGPDIVRLLKPVVTAERYRVTPAMAQFYKEMNGRLMPYRLIRDAMEGIGIGDAAQADHLLERRFRKTFEGLEGLAHGEEADEFLSLLVPYNGIAVENLRKAFAAADLGPLTVPYTHVYKTSRMQALVPKARQGKYTVQEIYDAYRLLYIHEFGFGEKLFGGVLQEIFTELFRLTKIEARAAGAKAATDIRLAHANNTRALDTTPKSAKDLRRSINRARRRP